MAITQVGICNSALLKLGAKTIGSITENTKEAQLCKAMYDIVRDEVLQSHPWNFAIKRTPVLSADATAPLFGYDYAYQIPSDCLRVIETNYDETVEDVDYAIEGAFIVCDYTDFQLRYIYRNTDESSWSSMFAEAMAWRLARAIAYAMTNSTEREKACDDHYKASVALARSADAAEGTMKGFIADKWINARQR